MSFAQMAAHYQDELREGRPVTVNRSTAVQRAAAEYQQRVGSWQEASPPISQQQHINELDELQATRKQLLDAQQAIRQHVMENVELRAANRQLKLENDKMRALLNQPPHIM